MAGKKSLGFTAKFAITVSALLLAVNVLLGIMLVSASRGAIKTLIHNRMLDIANSAADMLDGDALARLRAEDKDTPEYRAVNDTLAVFQDNIDLKYIYCVRDGGDGTFTFTVDPTIEDPGVFGEPVVCTAALVEAGRGKSAVDEEPYSDSWGRFYSAYSPVFTSNGEVGGIVAVDFSADWYDQQISKQTRLILFSSLLAVGFGILLVFITTGRLRKQIKNMTCELLEVSRDVDELTREINSDGEEERAADHNDEVIALAGKIHQIKEGLRSYTQKVRSQANSMITALSADYRGVYYIDLDKGEGICYQSHSQLVDGLQKGEHFPYIAALRAYAEEFVTEKYRDDFLRFISPENVRKGLENEEIITFLYMIRRSGVESYEMVRMAGVRHPKDRDDHLVHAIGMGFTDVDAETRRTLTQSQALSDALASAESANKAKTAFLSNMSHEIRTPMNAIIGLNRIALGDQTISASTREQLEKIGAAASHLLDIINDILDMSRIEAGRMTLRREVFSLPALLEQVSAMIGSQCRDKGLRWSVSLPELAGKWFVGDDMRLKEVLINILGNAVKFTPEGGEVRLSAELVRRYEKKSAFRFVVSDTGIGMGGEFLSRLFEPFSQEDITTKTKYGSTGLGMSITKSIVEMMNGEISVESEKGRGSTFTVTLTLDDSERADEPSDADGGEAEGEADLSGLRVLVAEDVDVNAEILQAVLEMRGIESDRAANGRIAVEMFEKSPERHYGAILMDMRMPEMDGLEATRAIRALSRGDAKSVPVVALTANAFDEDVQRSLQSGLNAHLSKPIDPDTLFSTLGRLVSGRGA